MVWVGGVITLSALAYQLVRAGDSDGVARFVGSLRVVGPAAAVSGERDKAVRLLSRWALGSLLILVLLVAATWDMVFKPGL